MKETLKEHFKKMNENGFQPVKNGEVIMFDEFLDIFMMGGKIDLYRKRPNGEEVIYLGVKIGYSDDETK